MYISHIHILNMLQLFYNVHFMINDLGKRINFIPPNYYSIVIALALTNPQMLIEQNAFQLHFCLQYCRI